MLLIRYVQFDPWEPVENELDMQLSFVTLGYCSRYKGERVAYWQNCTYIARLITVWIDLLQAIFRKQQESIHRNTLSRCHLAV